MARHRATDDPTDRDSTDDESADHGPTAHEPTGGDALDSFADRPLTPEIADNLQALFGTDERPETFGAWTDAVAAAFGDDWPPAVADLCHDDEGRHRAETGAGTEDGSGTESEAGAESETYRFVCVLDAVMLPFLTDESVTVYSEGPETGETVTSEVAQAGIETDPEDAVLSFGVAPVSRETELTPGLTYESLCPYVHAFPDETAYERWAAGIDAPTMALPLSEGFGLVRALVRA